MQTLVRLILPVLLLAAASQAVGEDARAALMERDREFDRVTAQQGRSGWLSFFALDAVIFPTKGAIVRGKDEIAAYYESSGFSPSGLRWEPAGAEASEGGDLGITWGTWTLSAEGKGVVARGKYLTTWRRTGAGWFVLADIGNQEPRAAAP